MEKAIIVKASRCIMGEGRYVLMGYDAQDKEVFCIPHNARNPTTAIRWVRGGKPRQDLKTIKAAYDKFHADAAAEAATSDT